MQFIVKLSIKGITVSKLTMIGCLVLYKLLFSCGLWTAFDKPVY